MVLLFQILNADLNVFVDFQPRVVHLTQCIILFRQILENGTRNQKVILIEVGPVAH